MEPAQSTAAAVYGAPEDDLHSLCVPDAVAAEFVACFSSLPRVGEFGPNARGADSDAQLRRFGSAAALALLLLLLRRHAPDVADALWSMEAALKGHHGPHPPHLRLRNLHVGTLRPGDAVPKSDDPRDDPAAYAAGPCLSELLLLAINGVLGFAPLVVDGEKAGLPVHHHVPVAAHEASGTSISWKQPIAVHTEDLHVSRLYGHFCLFGKLGNASAHTPLWTVRSFLSRIPPKDCGWMARAMALPFLLRPGAGRMDAATERLVAPILARQWYGRTVLRYNAAEYNSLRDGSRILRVDVLPPEWYRDNEQAALAARVLPELRARFRDVNGVARAPPSASMTQQLTSLVVATGDVLLVSNKAGPHCRTTFDGPRYVQRLYADYGADALWDEGLNFSSLDARQAHLAACVARDFDAEQVAHLEAHLGVPLATASAPDAAPDEHGRALAAALSSLEAAIDDAAHLLMEDGPGSPAVTACVRAASATQPRDLLDPLRRLHARLGDMRRCGGGAWRALPPAAVLPLRACCDALLPLAFRTRDDNLHQELLRVRAAAAAPGAMDAIHAAVKAATAALDSLGAPEIIM